MLFNFIARTLVERPYKVINPSASWWSYKSPVLNDAENEKKKVVAEARKTADEEYQRIVTDAHKTASQIKDDAEAEAISQKEQILKKAEKEIADMVVDAAAKVVGSNSADTNAALYDTFLNKAGDK